MPELNPGNKEYFDDWVNENLNVLVTSILWRINPDTTEVIPLEGRIRDRILLNPYFAAEVSELRQRAYEKTHEGINHPLHFNQDRVQKIIHVIEALYCEDKL